MKQHRRRSIRLPNYDYSQEGAYFLTICTQDQVCLFGDIVEGEMVLNDAGRMIQEVWDKIPEFYDGVGVDYFQMMPNHVHGIVIITGVGAGPCARPYDTGHPQGGAPTRRWSLPDIAHRFKTMTTKRYCDGVKNYYWPEFNQKLWQRNYYEHVIRNERDLSRIRQYIFNNPANWEKDENFR